MRVLAVVVGAAIAMALTPSIAHAQAPTPPPGGQAPPGPPPHKFTRSVTTSISLESGRTDLNGIQIQFDGQRPYEPNGEMRVYFSYAHATSAAPGQDVRTTVANRLTTAFDVAHDLSKKLLMMARVQALRDPVAQVSYRIGEMVGVGPQFVGKRARIRVVPGVAFLQDDKNVVADKGFAVHYGIFEDFTATISPEWSFGQSVTASRDFADRDDYVLSFDAKLTGAITKLLGIQLSYQYDFDRILPPGVEPEYQKTSIGLQLKF